MGLAALSPIHDAQGCNRSQTEVLILFVREELRLAALYIPKLV